MQMQDCKKCGKGFVKGCEKCPWCGYIEPEYKEPELSYEEKREATKGRGLMEYKVVSAEDQWLIGGRFDKTSLQNMLNSYAVHGWKVREMVIGKTTGLITGFSRDEMMIVLERNADYDDSMDGSGVGGETKVGDFI